MGRMDLSKLNLPATRTETAMTTKKKGTMDLVSNGVTTLGKMAAPKVTLVSELINLGKGIVEVYQHVQCERERTNQLQIQADYYTTVNKEEAEQLRIKEDNATKRMEQQCQLQIKQKLLELEKLKLELEDKNKDRQIAYFKDVDTRRILNSAFESMKQQMDITFQLYIQDISNDRLREEFHELQKELQYIINRFMELNKG